MIFQSLQMNLVKIPEKISISYTTTLQAVIVVFLFPVLQ